MSELKFKSSSGKSFLTPEVLKSELDYLDLHFLQEGTITICELVFNLQEKSISDYFKAVLFQDSITRKIHFSCDEIFGPVVGVTKTEDIDSAIAFATD